MTKKFKFINLAPLALAALAAIALIIACGSGEPEDLERGNYLDSKTGLEKELDSLLINKGGESSTSGEDQSSSSEEPGGPSETSSSSGEAPSSSGEAPSSSSDEPSSSSEEPSSSSESLYVPICNITINPIKSSLPDRFNTFDTDEIPIVVKCAEKANPDKFDVLNLDWDIDWYVNGVLDGRFWYGPVEGVYGIEVKIPGEARNRNCVGATATCGELTMCYKNSANYCLSSSSVEGSSSSSSDGGDTEPSSSSTCKPVTLVDGTYRIPGPVEEGENDCFTHTCVGTLEAWYYGSSAKNIIVSSCGSDPYPTGAGTTANYKTICETNGDIQIDVKGRIGSASNYINLRCGSGASSSSTPPPPPSSSSVTYAPTCTISGNYNTGVGIAAPTYNCGNGISGTKAQFSATPGNPNDGTVFAFGPNESNKDCTPTPCNTGLKWNDATPASQSFGVAATGREIRMYKVTCGGGEIPYTTGADPIVGEGILCGTINVGTPKSSSSSAVATYTVTYSANSGAGAPAAQTKTHDVALTLSATVPTRTGYTFAGWNTVAGGGGTSYAAGASYTANATVTLYAQWTANTYTVAYDANGGMGAPSAQTKTHDVALTLSATVPTRTGYTFAGWNTVAGGGGTSYAAGASYTANATVTLYAQWTDNTAPTLYTITYSGNGNTSGTAPTAQAQTAAGQALTLAAAGSLVRTGYLFGGWGTTTTGGTITLAGANYIPTANVTLYAVWTRVYTVTYDGNGNTGGTAPTAQTQTAGGQALTLAVVGNLVKTGNTFNGWNTVAGGTGTNYAAGTSYTPTADITLYAKWITTATPITIIEGASNIGTSITADGVYTLTCTNTSKSLDCNRNSNTMLEFSVNGGTKITQTINNTPIKVMDKCVNGTILEVWLKNGGDAICNNRDTYW